MQICFLSKCTFFYKSLHFTGKWWTNQENAFLRSISRVNSPLMCKTQTSARVMSRHCVTAHGRFPDVQSQRAVVKTHQLPLHSGILPLCFHGFQQPEKQSVAHPLRAVMAAVTLPTAANTYKNIRFTH